MDINNKKYSKTSDTNILRKFQVFIVIYFCVIVTKNKIYIIENWRYINILVFLQYNYFDN